MINTYVLQNPVLTAAAGILHGDCSSCKAAAAHRHESLVARPEKPSQPGPRRGPLPGGQTAGVPSAQAAQAAGGAAQRPEAQRRFHQHKKYTQLAEQRSTMGATISMAPLRQSRRRPRAHMCAYVCVCVVYVHVCV